MNRDRRTRLLPFSFLATVLLFSAIPSPAGAQSDLPLVLSAGTHALTVPWYPAPMSSGFNPAVMMGTDRDRGPRGRGRFFLGANLGFFRHRWWMSGVSIEPELGYGGTFSGGLHADMRIGLGYMHYFWRRESLELKEGEYVSVSSRGHPSLILPISVNLGYRGREANPLSVSPFVAARWGVQGLFLQELPAMTHFSFMGGVRIERNPDKSNGGR